MKYLYPHAKRGEMEVKMKVLAIAHEKNLNGATLSLLDILNYLSINEDVTLFVPFLEGNVINVAKNKGLKVICKNYSRWMVSGSDFKYKLKQYLKWNLINKRKNDEVVKEIASLVKNESFDLLYTNTRVIDLGARISKITGIKHIWHFREFGEEDFGLKPIQSYRYHIRMINTASNMILVNSLAVANKFTKILKAEMPIYVVANGVGNEHVFLRQFKNKYKTVNFLITGRISTAKGHNLIAKAINILIQRDVNNFIVYAAGLGDLESVCGSDWTKENKDHFIELGQIENIFEIRKDMDVELMCSNAEAFGRVTVEAMMSSMPVVGSNSGGTVELITDKKNGLLFECNNPNSLADKMEYLIKNTQEIENMGTTAYFQIKDKYTVQKCCSSVEAYMKECIGVTDFD